MTCVMLRALVEAGAVNCLGILVSPAPDAVVRETFLQSAHRASNVDGVRTRRASLTKAEDSNAAGAAPSAATGADGAAPTDEPKEPAWEAPTLDKQARELRDTLNSLGLAHVPLLVAATNDGGRGINPTPRGCDDDDDGDGSPNAGDGDARGERGSATPAVTKKVAGDDPSAAATLTAEEHLLQLYADAPPMGVSLVVCACATDAARFANRNPVLFRSKTARVVMLGGAQVAAKGDGGNGDDSPHTGANSGHASEMGPAPSPRLEPDPDAQNNRLDMQSASKLFAQAQALSVPLVVLSRHLAYACRAPRLLFDALASHGGLLGVALRDSQRACIMELWSRANAPSNDTSARRGLPARCDRTWFMKTFSSRRASGFGDETMDVWPQIDSFNVYNPLALVAALPVVVKRCFEVGAYSSCARNVILTRWTDETSGESSHFEYPSPKYETKIKYRSLRVLTDSLQAKSVTVRSATHLIIGESAASSGVKDAEAVRGLIYQCLFKGTRLNSSDYGLEAPPSLPLDLTNGATAMPSSSSVWHFDTSERALSWLVPAPYDGDVHGEQFETAAAPVSEPADSATPLPITPAQSDD